jgi:hypothetical protein
MAAIAGLEVQKARQSSQLLSFANPDLNLLPIQFT